MLFYCLIEFYGFIRPDNTSKIKAYRGSTVLLDCRVNITYPDSGLIWTKDSILLQTTNNSIALPNGMLIILELNDSDIGNYTCEVDNGLIKGDKRQTLSVEMIPHTGKSILYTICMTDFEHRNDSSYW